MSTPVSDLYDELIHYTTLAGLQGIVTSGCLWATDAEFLNDSSEITHFFDAQLADMLAPDVRRFVLEVARQPEHLAQIINDGGFETVIKSETTSLVTTLREATLAFNRPFVLSLSGPSDDRIRHSGLLSQWRGYGGDGGYALVLDTKRFEELVAAEAATHQYLQVQLGDVYYHGIEPSIQPATPDVADAAAVICPAVSKLLRGDRSELAPGFYEAITGLSCRCKHWGFWEEREVRVVATVAKDKFSALAADHTLPAKSIRTFVRGQQQVPYVALFELLAQNNPLHRLPIKRVIVGPHRNRVAHAEEVKSLLAAHGYVADVVQSEIPYIGR